MTDHSVSEQNGEYVCEICGSRWKRLPGGNALPCPGVPVYWDWGAAPAHLKTKRQLSEMGLSVGSMAPAACLPNTRRNRAKGYFWIWLYDAAQARPKKPLTPAQAAARDHLVEKHRRSRTCLRCGAEQENRSDLLDGICSSCQQQILVSEARADAAAWARGILARSDWAAIDFETTGLEDPEAVQVAVLAPDGQELFFSLIRPVGGIDPGAIEVHGITPEMVAGAPSFPEIYADLAAVLLGKMVLSYNADFDRMVLDGECRRNNLPRLNLKWECAMIRFASWTGEWSDYWDDFKWQPLPGGDHTALGDCMAVLGLISEMAQSITLEQDPEDAQPQ